MFTDVTDDEFERHVTLIAHTMAFRAYFRCNPGVSRSEAWKHAALHWDKFVDPALEFLAIQVLHRGVKRTPGHELN